MGGNPELAREFARWLHRYEENIGVIENASEYEFPDKVIQVYGHKVNDDPVEINVRDCMVYLTKNFNQADILQDQLIKEHKTQQFHMASAVHGEASITCHYRQ